MSIDAKHEFDIELPVDLIVRGQKLNTDYLMYVRDVARRDPVAAVSLGLSNEMVEIFEKIELRKLVEIASCGILLTKIRFNDVDFWQSVSDGTIDCNSITHRLLIEV